MHALTGHIGAFIERGQNEIQKGNKLKRVE